MKRIKIPFYPEVYQMIMERTTIPLENPIVEEEEDE